MPKSLSAIEEGIWPFLWVQIGHGYLPVWLSLLFVRSVSFYQSSINSLIYHFDFLVP
jgi:hypothetical protein